MLLTRRNRSDLPATVSRWPFTGWGDINRLFDEMTRDIGLTPLLEERGFAFSPSVNISEDDSSYHVEAELPGLAEKDVEVSLANDILTIKGEKKDEKEEKSKHYVRRERVYGSFERQFTLPAEVDAEKIDAQFKNGILTVELPKSKKAKEEVRKIAIKAS
jgi:HSP20 family protein